MTKPSRKQLKNELADTLDTLQRLRAELTTTRRANNGQVARRAREAAIWEDTRLEGVAQVQTLARVNQDLRIELAATRRKLQRAREALEAHPEAPDYATAAQADAAIQALADRAEALAPLKDFEPMAAPAGIIEQATDEDGTVTVTVPPPNSEAPTAPLRSPDALGPRQALVALLDAWGHDDPESDAQDVLDALQYDPPAQADGWAAAQRYLDRLPKQDQQDIVTAVARRRRGYTDPAESWFTTVAQEMGYRGMVTPDQQAATWRLTTEWAKKFLHAEWVAAARGTTYTAYIETMLEDLSA